MESKTIIKTDFQFPSQTNVYKGKVRDVYTIGDDLLVMIAFGVLSLYQLFLLSMGLMKNNEK